MSMEKSIVCAVTEAINAGDVDGEWRRGFYGQARRNIYAANECFSMCSGNDARHDFYAMWYPENRKRQAIIKDAAPELLDALEKIESGSFVGASSLVIAGDWQAFATKAQEIARAAIAKAKGQS